MSFTSVPNLKEIETWEGFLIYLQFCAKKKKQNVKKTVQFSRTNISRNLKVISCSFEK